MSGVLTFISVTLERLCSSVRNDEFWEIILNDVNVYVSNTRLNCITYRSNVLIH